MDKIIGREKEKETLHKLLESNRPCFVALYGRRRIGKTYLIKNFFKSKGLFFHLTGVQNASLEIQIQNFAYEFSDHFRKGKAVERPKDWFEAFQWLRKEIEKIPKDVKVILFFDELPWLATPKSQLVPALEHLWNRYLSNLSNVIVVVCGSAASWMIDQVINSKGGLYGRVTHAMRLLPFTLSETEAFLHEKHIHLDRKQLIELYMCLGGVAKYLTYVERGKSAAEVIGELCFTYDAPLLAEFHKLYQSLFKHYEDHIEIVRALGKKRSGLSYQELSKQMPSGGSLTKKLDELVQSGFVVKMPQFEKGEKGLRYVLVDEFSLFHLAWNSGVSAIDLQGRGADYWLKQRNTQSWKTWAGFAFENVCLKHIDKIKEGLGLRAVHTKTSKWKGDFNEVGAEIDLVIDRADQCINICEMKFYDDEFVINKEYAEKLKRKKVIFQENTKTKKATFLTFITAFGVKKNEHAISLIDQELKMDHLF